MASDLNAQASPSDSYERTAKFVGSRIKELRLLAGLTQTEIASRSGTKQSGIFELESGEVNITLKTLVKMADVLNVAARDLLPGSQSGPPSTASIDRLAGVFERVSVILAEYEAQESLRRHQQTQLLAELRAFTDIASFLRASHGGISEPTSPSATSPLVADTSHHS